MVISSTGNWSLFSSTSKYNISRYADHPDELVSDDEDDEFDEQEISDDIDESLYEFLRFKKLCVDHA